MKKEIDEGILSAREEKFFRLMFKVKDPIDLIGILTLLGVVIPPGDDELDLEPILEGALAGFRKLNRSKQKEFINMIKKVI